MVSAINRNSSALGSSSGWASATVRRPCIDLDVGNGNGPCSVAVGKWTDGGGCGLLVMAWPGCADDQSCLTGTIRHSSNLLVKHYFQFATSGKMRGREAVGAACNKWYDHRLSDSWVRFRFSTWP
jgi:hypothetical protein